MKNVTANEPFFEGHFPGQPVMPGVLILEAMAQTGGILLLNGIENPEGKLVFFMAINNVKFRKPVTPGDQLVFELTMLNRKSKICQMVGKAFVDGNLVAEAEMMASIIERKDPKAQPLDGKRVPTGVAAPSKRCHRQVIPTNDTQESSMSTMHTSARTRSARKLSWAIMSALDRIRIIEDYVRIGDGTVIGANALIGIRARIGKDCRIHHGAVVGHAPQDLKYDERTHDP